MTIQKKISGRLTVWLLILLLIPASGSVAEVSTDDYLANGQQLYEAEQYQKALDIFLLAVDQEPDNSVYHHWLAKCYGRLAEKSWLIGAYNLSKKTRFHLEKSVELNDTDIDALLDLMKFYQQAPGFLGGGPEKAAAICQKIRKLNLDEIDDSGEMDLKLPEKC